MIEIQGVNFAASCIILLGIFMALVRGLFLGAGALLAEYDV